MMSIQPVDVQRVLNLLRARITGVLGDNLVGLYLIGSLVTGDFDEEVSDIDLVAVTSTDLTRPEIAALAEMHRAIAREEQRWDNRIEVIYLTSDALRTFRTWTSTIAVTSPGEPFHTKEAGRDWLINWYVLREKGVALLGPSPKTLVEPITMEDLVQCVRHHARWWRERVKEMQHRNAQVYATLTLCRALYTVRTGGFTSKRQAALWAAKELPEWSPLIHAALRSWREDWYRPDVDHQAAFAATVSFVNAVVDEILGRNPLPSIFV